MSAKQELEHTLAGMANRKYCLLVSRGATALYISYEALKKQHPGKTRIVLPATMCHSPANVATYAGLQPIFCDVTTTDYTLDPVCLEAILTSTPGVLAVVSASMFGHSPDMKSIAAICKNNHVALIDDAAQSIGGSSFGVPSGGWGGIGIFSFGHTKIIDVGWGGAILTDDESIYTTCKNDYEALPLPANDIQELRAVYSETYYTAEKLTFKSPALNPLFWNFPQIFKSLYVYREETRENKVLEIIARLKELQQVIAERNANWKLYRNNLKENASLYFPQLREGMVSWRFTFRISSEKRNKIVEELRNRQIDVSCWYPSLQPRFRLSGDINNIECRSAAALTKELVNLWVDPGHTGPEQIIKTCDLINELLK